MVHKNTNEIFHYRPIYNIPIHERKIVVHVPCIHSVEQSQNVHNVYKYNPSRDMYG